MFNEENQRKVTESLNVSKGEKKMVHLTIDVMPEDGREKKKRVPKGVRESRDGMDVDQQVARLRQNVLESEGVKVKLNWDPSAFVAEHMPMEVPPR